MYRLFILKTVLYKRIQFLLRCSRDPLYKYRYNKISLQILKFSYENCDMAYNCCTTDGGQIVTTMCID